MGPAARETPRQTRLIRIRTARRRTRRGPAAVATPSLDATRQAARSAPPADMEAPRPLSPSRPQPHASRPGRRPSRHARTAARSAPRPKRRFPRRRTTRQPPTADRRPPRLRREGPRRQHPAPASRRKGQRAMRRPRWRRAESCEPPPAETTALAPLPSAEGERAGSARREPPRALTFNDPPPLGPSTGAGAKVRPGPPPRKTRPPQDLRSRKARPRPAPKPPAQGAGAPAPRGLFCRSKRRSAAEEPSPR